MTKPELEKKIFIHLTKVNFSTFDEMKNILKCSDEDLMGIIKNNTKTNSEPLGFILINDKTKPPQYSIESTNYLTIHTQVENYLKGINGVLGLFYRNLTTQSNLFKTDSDATPNMNNKAKTIFDNISLILSFIRINPNGSEFVLVLFLIISIKSSSEHLKIFFISSNVEKLTFVKCKKIFFSSSGFVM